VRSTLVALILLCTTACNAGILLRRESLEPIELEPARTYRTVVDYRRSGFRPYWDTETRQHKRARWTPTQIIELLKAYPKKYVDMGVRNSDPPGSVNLREMGRIVNEVQALATEQGVDAGRLMVHYRSDVLIKKVSGFADCTLPDADLCTWEGDMKGTPFDPSWIMLVPRSEHAWSVTHLWGGDPAKDPWNPAGAHLWQWPVDKAAVEKVNTPTHVAALYGPVKNYGTAEEPSYAISVATVVMDLRNPKYRAWTTKRLIAHLQSMGVDPGEEVAVQVTYKPGWHTYYDEGKSTDPCFFPGSRMWSGPARYCGLTGRVTGGPFVRTPYGPGEFEDAVNALLWEMRVKLVQSGYPDVKLATVEQPLYKERWVFLTPVTRSQSWLIGDLELPRCDRTDLSVAANSWSCGSE
jgi:hypothetical protein